MSSFNAKTYRRKSSAKRKQPLSSDPDGDQDLPALQLSKRPRVSLEVVKPAPATTLKQKKAAREVSTDIEDDSPPAFHKPGSVHITYGTPKRAKSPPSSPPQRQPTLARDLSALFQSVTPTASPLSSPTKLAKRMLARSKTDSSIDSQVQSTSISAGRIERTPSLPNLPSSSSPPKPSLSFDHAPAPAPAPTRTRTYAGKSRSFLVALPSSGLSSSALGGAEDEEDDYSTRESYTSLRTRWGVDNSEDDPYPPYSNISPSRSAASTSTPSGSPSKSRKGGSKATQGGAATAQVPLSLPNGMMNPLKSISELRDKGESRRFLDEVGYLFEGMDSGGGVGLRRASALEITTKLCDAEFTRKAKAADFLGRTWDVFGEAGAGRGEDKILDTILAFFAALVARDPASLIDLAQRTPPPLSPPALAPTQKQQHKLKQQKKKDQGQISLVSTLFSLLLAPADPLALIPPSSKLDKAAQDAELKNMGLGKKDRGLLTTIYTIISSKSYLFPSGTSISTPLLLTQTLKTLPPSLIPASHFPALLASLRASLTPLPSSSSASSNAYLSWPDTAASIPYERIYNHLRLLDTYILGQWASPSSIPSPLEPEATDDEMSREDEEVQRVNMGEMNNAREWLVDGLVGLGVCAEINCGASALRCTEISLRVLVTLTHGDARWGRAVMECTCALGFVARTVLGAGLNMGMRMELDGMGVVREGGVKHEDDISDGKGTEGDGEVGTQALDKLCLALGLLTNLVQVVDGVKDVIRETRLSPTCNLKKRSCIRQCTCAHSISALDVLVRLYARQPSPSPLPTKVKSENTPPPSPLAPTSIATSADADADASFLRGHLAVLFGLLMRECPSNQAYILAALPAPPKSGKASDRAKLSRLVDQARDFVAFYAVVGMSGSGVRREGEGEEDVAKDVVLFLEKLRDDSGRRFKQ